MEVVGISPCLPRGSSQLDRYLPVVPPTVISHLSSRANRFIAPACLNTSRLPRLASRFEQTARYPLATSKMATNINLDFILPLFTLKNFVASVTAVLGYYVCLGIYRSSYLCLTNI